MAHPAAVHRRTRDQLIQQAGGVCAVCGSSDRLAIDHVYAAARGGLADQANLQVLCLRCNCSKGARTMEEWLHSMRRLHAKAVSEVDRTGRLLRAIERLQS